MAAKKSGSPSYDFVLGELKRNPKVAFADVQAKGEKKGFGKIYPIVYGRAKKALGLAGGPAAKRSKKKATRKTSTGRPVGRPPGRRGRPAGRRAVASSAAALGDFASVLDAMKQNEAERERYRRALEDIRSIIDAALAD